MKRAQQNARRCALGALVALVMLVVCATNVSAQDVFSDQKIELKNPAGTSGATKASATGPSIGRVVLSLGGVALLIVGLGYVYRRMVGQQQAKGGAVTLVSRSILTPKHQVMVLRVGHRLVVVGDGGNGMNTLCEIDDPSEVSAVLSAAGGDVDELRAQAFSATLDGAESHFAIPGGDSDPIEEPPADDTMFAGASREVQGLLDRVRGLTKQVQRDSGS